MRLLVIDGNSIANRAFYGIKLLTTKDGRYTNAIFGFLNILLSLLKESEPDEVAVAFDLKAPTFRHKMYDGYKATRHKMPDELAAQLPVIRQLLALLGYREVTAEGWEADDILGTLAAACAARSDDCFLATGDRDSLQLVSDTRPRPPQLRWAASGRLRPRISTFRRDAWPLRLPDGSLQAGSQPLLSGPQRRLTGF